MSGASRSSTPATRQRYAETSSLKDDAQAEDTLQEPYLLAYRSIATFRHEAKLSTWLVRIIANEAKIGAMRIRAIFVYKDEADTRESFWILQ